MARTLMYSGSVCQLTNSSLNERVGTARLPIYQIYLANTSQEYG